MLGAHAAESLLLKLQPAPSTASLPFVYYDPPDLLSASPPTASAIGGTMVTLAASAIPALGPGCTGAPLCRFGEATSPATKLSADPSRVRCAAPPGLPATATTVALAVNGYDFGRGLPFYYTGAARRPELRSIHYQQYRL